MPELGEIKKASELDRKDSARYIWATCVDCGKERWVTLAKDKPLSPRCHSCANSIIGKKHIGSKNSHWKGGERYCKGYVIVLRPDHPCCWKDGYIKRARLVLEAKLGRYILPSMQVHHINGIKDDDRPENLEELPLSEHSRRTQRIKRSRQF